MRTYDLIVIGGGAGGLTVAAGAANMGARVALVEKADQLGGDCLHYGCIPSKALIEAAKKVHTAQREAAEFGLTITGKADLSVAKKRIQAAVAHIQKHDDADRFRKLGVDVFHSQGRFKDPHHVEIESGAVLRGKRIVIATGSRPLIPSIAGIEDISYFTNETIFEWEAAPKRLIVIGAGPVGLELAQSLARFGSRVQVIESAPGIFGKEDPDLVPYIQEALEQEITLLLNSQVEKVAAKGNGEKIITLNRTGERSGERETLVADEILVAAGRTPNIEGLGLEHIGVQVENGQIVVHKTLQTSVPHIYALGDVIGTFPFTHAANLEAKVVVANAVFGLKQKVNYAHTPWVTYTDPEVYHLGLSEREAREQYGDQIAVYQTRTADSDRFVADRDLNGFVKVITNRKGRILGAHAVGTRASDWMQEIVFAKQQGHKLGDISRVIHPYPTHGAILQQLADQYWRKKLFSGWIPRVLKKYIRWFR